MSKTVFILGGHQTDYAVNYTKAGKELVDIFKDTVRGGLESAKIEPHEIDVAHVGNFMGELQCMQGHLGAFFLECDPVFRGLPTARHEAACASGSIATLAAMAEIEAGRYDVACVLGVEMQRNRSGKETAQHLGVAAWFDRECQGVEFPFPDLFGKLGDEYEKRYGLKREHLAHIAKVNFDNARRNPNAQTRTWTLTDESFTENDEHNPVIAGCIRRQDCSQVTDGGACVFLASEEFAQHWAERNGKSLGGLPRIKGWGHTTAPILFGDKMQESKDNPYILPHVREAILAAFARAGMPGVEAVNAIETHDCFTPTEYMAIDHFGLTAPGESWKAIEDGVIDLGGETPINPSGGLMGVGHPVGASGVRMLLDATKQVTGAADGYQVEGAKNVSTLNIGGSGTTTVSFVVGMN
ncbi:MAG: acetyl-CoA acetyltransferase [Candidatus Hydrogenedentota bacterium]